MSFPPDPPSSDIGQAFEDYWAEATSNAQSFPAVAAVLRAFDQNITDPTANANARQMFKESHQRAWLELQWYLDHSGAEAAPPSGGKQNAPPPPIVQAKRITTAGTQEAEPLPPI